MPKPMSVKTALRRNEAYRLSRLAWRAENPERSAKDETGAVYLAPPELRVRVAGGEP
jgi:hypothetical protein